MFDRPHQSKQKRVASVPTELVEFINLVNGLPKLACDTGTMERDVRLASPGLGSFDVMKQIANRFEADLERMPAYLREYIGPARDAQGLLTDVYSQARYNKLVMARAVLDLIALTNDSGVQLSRMRAQTNKDKSQRRDVKAVTRDHLLMAWERLPLREVLLIVSPEPKLPPTIDRSEMAVSSQWREFTVGLGWDIEKTRKGRELRVRSFPRLEVIEGIDCLRIRRCNRCSKFFFAVRMHQLAYPETCAHILRTQRWRDAYPEKYKRQRVTQSNVRDARTNQSEGNTS